MRRTISIVVAGVLTVGVVFTVLASERGSKSKHLRVVHGITSAENGPFFGDARVKSAFAAHGLALQVDTVMNDRVVTTADLSRYDFAFLTEAATAAHIATARHIATFAPFHSPMVVATFKDVAQRLTKAGIAQEDAGWWTLDTQRYLDLVRRHVRWNQLPGNVASNDNTLVFITSPGVTTSEGAMYASLASSVANNGAVVGSQAQVDEIVNDVSPLFLAQGPAQTSTAPFNHYTEIGGLAPAMVWTYEARFVAHAAAHDGTIHPDSVLMYPTPGVVADYTLLPFTPTGSEAGKLLTADPMLQRLAGESGFRTTKEPAALAAFARQNGVEVPVTLPHAIPLPTYDNLQALVTRVEAALLAALGPGPATAATSQSVPIR